jgi:hypothetical protein
MWGIYAVILAVILGPMLGLHLAKRTQKRATAAVKRQRDGESSGGAYVRSAKWRDAATETVAPGTPSNRKEEAAPGNATVQAAMTYTRVGSVASDNQNDGYSREGSTQHSESSNHESCGTGETGGTSNYSTSDSSCGSPSGDYNP